jgi:hypothetical protein
MPSKKYLVLPYSTYYGDETNISELFESYAIIITITLQGTIRKIDAGRLVGLMFKTFYDISMAVLIGIRGHTYQPSASYIPLGTYIWTM